jgi:small subunit ribosomal protein S17e
MILEKHPDLFTTDFEKNKELLSEVAIIRTKALRNEIAGYITAAMRDEMEEPEGQTVEDAIAQPAE